MFGKPPTSPNGNPPSTRRASDVARIEGGGLVQAIVTALSPFTFYLFLNDTLVPQSDIESLSVNVELSDYGSPTINASLTRNVRSVDGKTTQQFSELFPSTVEIVAVGRRVSVSCSDPSTIESVEITLGLRPDGSGGEVSGAKALRILITDGILDGKLTWTDGEVEDLFPQP